MAKRLCPACDQPFTGARCGCGGMPAVAPLNDAPVAPVDQLQGVIRVWQASGKPWPQQLPHDPLEAAKRWMQIQQPRSVSESVRKMPGMGSNDGTRWIDPYADRLKANLRTYCSRDVSSEFRDIIIAASEEHIWWHGHDERMFARVIEETLTYREDPVAYRTDTPRRIKAMFARVLA